VESFLFAFDSNLKPVVGQQVTLGSTNAHIVAHRIDLLISRAEAGDCDLVVKGDLNRVRVGFLYVGNGRFRQDSARLPALSDAIVRSSVREPDDVLTYTCVPPGSGYRIGIDRDNDGVLDRDSPRR
jgi:hypothetical protein